MKNNARFRDSQRLKYGIRKTLKENNVQQNVTTTISHMIKQNDAQKTNLRMAAWSTFCIVSIILMI